MKDYRVVVEFRRAYRKLGYEKNKMKVSELFAWVAKWCKNNRIPNDFVRDFQQLALAYVDKEWYENAIERGMKKYSRAYIVIC